MTQTAVGLYDERQKAAVDLHKSLETDELFGIGLGEEFKDISFGLYVASDLTARTEVSFRKMDCWKWFPWSPMRTAAFLPLLPLTCRLAATM